MRNYTIIVIVGKSVKNLAFTELSLDRDRNQSNDIIQVVWFSSCQMILPNDLKLALSLMFQQIYIYIYMTNIHPNNAPNMHWFVFQRLHDYKEPWIKYVFKVMSHYSWPIRSWLSIILVYFSDVLCDVL